VLACGGRGVISASANIIPELFVKMIECFEKGDVQGSLRYQIQALPMVRLMFKESNPVPVKAALAIKGIIKSGAVRLPLLTATQDTIEKIQALIQK
jgi:4-hydroxy-tetrahydrodipicolinate synthase